MKKKEFLRLLQNNHSIKDDDLKKIIGLESVYPYSQVLRTLSALGSRKLKLADSNKKLTDAAVYATNRNVLKKLLLSLDETVVDNAIIEIPQKDKDTRKTESISASAQLSDPRTKKVVKKPD